MRSASFLGYIAAAVISGNACVAAPLILAEEAALPAASVPAPTRGISRGPTVRLISPMADTSIKSPFDFKVAFDPRGDSKVDLDSVHVVYIKSPFVDLTPRLLTAISRTGINFFSAEIPSGTHQIRVTVKDTDGRETNSLFTLVVVGK